MVVRDFLKKNSTIKKTGGGTKRGKNIKFDRGGQGSVSNLARGTSN